MNKYRIGRIVGHWVNFTPPIRGGVYRVNTMAPQHKPDDDSGDEIGSYWSSSLESLNSSTTSLDSITIGDFGSSDMTSSCSKKRLEQHSSSVPQDRATERRHNSSHAQILDDQGLSRVDYTSSAVQKAIDDNVRDNPSLDAKTQRAITLKYQLLHQRVKDEGFYLAFLRTEWYLTSACFLGLFWVSP